jgi:hypothetical protein
VSECMCIGGRLTCRMGEDAAVNSSSRYSRSLLQHRSDKTCLQGGGARMWVKGCTGEGATEWMAFGRWGLKQQ